MASITTSTPAGTAAHAAEATGAGARPSARRGLLVLPLLYGAQFLVVLDRST